MLSPVKSCNAVQNGMRKYKEPSINL